MSTSNWKAGRGRNLSDKAFNSVITHGLFKWVRYLRYKNLKYCHLLCNTNCNSSSCNLSGEAWLLFSPCPYILLPDICATWVRSHESVEFHVEIFNTQQLYTVLSYTIICCIFRIFSQILKVFIADRGNLKYFDCSHLCSAGTCNWVQLGRISHLCIRMRLSLLQSPIPFLPIWQIGGGNVANTVTTAEVF